MKIRFVKIIFQVAKQWRGGEQFLWVERNEPYISFAVLRGGGQRRLSGGSQHERMACSHGQGGSRLKFNPINSTSDQLSILQLQKILTVSDLRSLRLTPSSGELGRRQALKEMFQQLRHLTGCLSISAPCCRTLLCRASLGDKM